MRSLGLAALPGLRARLPAMTVKRRLVVGFGAVIAMLLVIVALDRVDAARLENDLRRTIDVNDARLALAHRLRSRIDDMAIEARSIALLSDADAIRAAVARFDGAERAYEQAAAGLAARLRSDGATAYERALVEHIGQDARATIPLIERAARQGREGSNVEATMTLMVQAGPGEAAWRADVARLVAFEQSATAEDDRATRAAARRIEVLVDAAAVLVIALSALIAWRITASIVRPIDCAVRVVERIAQGDLTSAVGATGRDELGHLLRMVGDMQRRLHEIVVRIRAAADGIHGASAQVADGNLDLSQRTEQAAAHLEQTSSALLELRGNVRVTAASAVEASRLAGAATEAAQRGEGIVGQVVESMLRIERSSSTVTEVVSVVEKIAFQTKLLALNAAVEAARAGEAGRGFAVVAGEVQALASRSADSARQIKDLIESSVETIRDGTQLADGAGRAMVDLLQGVRDVDRVMNEINAAASHQAQSLDAISGAVRHLDQTTQQNAALVEQSAAAAASLRAQAIGLVGSVSLFHLVSVPRPERDGAANAGPAG